MGFPGGTSGKNTPVNTRDGRHMGLFPGSGRSLTEGKATPVQYSCLKNPMDRGAWWATVHGAAKSRDMTEHTQV